MNPVLEAARLARERGADFKEEMEAFLLHGFVFSTPDAFLMGRPVPKGFELQDIWHEFPPDAELNSWMVWSAYGNAGRLLSMMPIEKPWVGWVRQGRGWTRTHWVKTAALRQRFAGKRFQQQLSV